MYFYKVFQKDTFTEQVRGVNLKTILCFIDHTVIKYSYFMLYYELI